MRIHKNEKRYFFLFCRGKESEMPEFSFFSFDDRTGCFLEWWVFPKMDGLKYKMENPIF